MESSVVLFVGEKSCFGVLILCFEAGELALEKAVFRCQLHRFRCIGGTVLGKERFQLVTAFFHLPS